ncbi:hypothetical protein A1O3_05530 [Capronia epimyces CBS 606.96]|uniref:Uncharacterized protein n=1 Tax=Capronia epimyces CBS 606.96 TaxID=1182542 RepID=W9Y5H3_9EURO|nr:uncharacterized protein A1O3_05530 [Capronia epimyces CBS 606.96]EXJ84855.1 hypothetical protein A1O3_05530 [Capronia epimyces CBS 606.96]
MWSLVSLSAALAHARILAFDKRLPLRFVGRGQPFANTTTPDFFFNRTTDAAFTSTSTDEFVPATSLASTTSVDANALDDATCTGSVTYYGSVPPTVYVTVTEGFDVTVTASNVSVTDTPTLITPLPACEATIMPLIGPNVLPNPSSSFYSATQSTQSPDGNSSSSFYSATQSPDGYIPGIIPVLETPANPPVPPESATAPLASQAPQGSQAPQASSMANSYSSVDYTSTVIVTKKTPATVVAPPTTAAGVNFQYPTDPTSSPPKNTGPSPSVKGAGGSGDDGNSNVDAPGQSGDADPPRVTSSAHRALASVDDNDAATPSSTPAEAPPTTTKLGDIIASIFYSGFATASTTNGSPTATAFTTNISNIPIVVLPSSVAIGGQTVAIPTSAPTTVQASGATFTVQPSEIIGQGTTITISPAQRQEGVPTSVPTSTFAIGDLTLTVGPTLAIISGTTYRIGQGAPATTLTVDGTAISVGSMGVGLPSTTLSAGDITQPPFVVYTAEGLTLSVDSSEAVISGTTHRIGSHAPQVTATIGSHSVSFGPGGVGLESTTIAPTAAPSSSASGSRKLTSTGASATQSAAPSNGASSETKVLSLKLLAWHLVAIPIVWLAL